MCEELRGTWALVEIRTARATVERKWAMGSLAATRDPR